MSVVLVVVAAGIATYALRVSMLIVAARRGLPAIVDRAARFALPVSFAAAATSQLAEHVGARRGDLAPMAAVAVAAVVARCTRRPDIALLASMPTLWVLSALLGR